MDLPKLHDTPTRHPDCCLSISTKLLKTITEILATTNGGPDKDNNFIVSVGSGSGLLEAHLQSHIHSFKRGLPGLSSKTSFTVKGVEVNASAGPAPVNKYLRGSQAPTVRGTWEVYQFVGNTDTIMFVYPRDPKLVSQYLRSAREGLTAPPLRVVLWLGPRADWEVFGGCFQGLEGFEEVEVIEGEEAGVAEFEMVAVVRRRR